MDGLLAMNLSSDVKDNKLSIRTCYEANYGSQRVATDPKYAKTLADNLKKEKT